MSGELMNSDGDMNNEVVVLDGGSSVSMKAVQSLYNEITGKTEKIAWVLRDNHSVQMGDLTNLDIKIKQLYEQYNIVSTNCNVTVYHVNNAKEQFSSFERFKFYDSSRTEPCESIRIEYDFLILLPKTKKVQPYKISINLMSRVGLREKALAEHSMARRFVRLVSIQTGAIDIEYVDYTVARNLKTTIDEWYKGVEKTCETSRVEVLQDYTTHLPFVFKLFTALVLILMFYFNSDQFLPDSATVNNLFEAAIVVGGGFILAVMSASKAGSLCENAIDNYQPLSSVNLNRGDELAVKKFKKTNFNSLVGAIFSIFFVISLNIASTYLSKLLGIG